VVKQWRDSFRSRSVVFISPFPTAECAQRLEAATVRGAAAFLGSASSRTGRRLYGTLGWPQVEVARVRNSGRGSLQVYFDGVIKPASGGGTMLRGTIGLRSPKLPFLVANSVVGLVFAAAITVGVVTGAVPGGHHHDPSLLLVPALLVAGFVVMLASIPDRARRQTQQLLDDLSNILGATATIEP
jgi:hypothetical protein